MSHRLPVVHDVVEPSAHAEYQDGSMVSCPINTDTTTITAFAVASDQRISEHSAPHADLITVINGSSHFTIEGVEHADTAG